MRLYWEVARRGYSRFATYRAATIAGVFTNTVFGFLRAYVLVAVFDARGGEEIGGYDIVDALTYVFVGQGMIMTVNIWGWYDIAVTIRSGDIVTDLQRPFDYQFYWMAQDMGRACYHFIFRGIPPFIVGMIAFDVRLPEDWWTWVFFVVSVVLAVCVSFAIRFTVNLWAFWLLDYRGAGALLTGLWTILSGFVIPIAFFPGWLQTVSAWLPFRCILQFPIDIFLEQRRGTEALEVFAIQIAWAAGLLIAGRFILSVATRRVVVQGG